jgi:hypothetical protein
MITSQLNLQRALGFDVTHMTERQRVDYIRDNALNVIGEVMEALNEVNWKPWSSGTEIRQDACFAELRDAWQHLTNTMWAVYGETAYALAQRLEEKLEEKHDVNYRRLIEGYDGHSTKCRRCRRALDDPAVHCVPDLDYCDQLDAARSPVTQDPPRPSA